VEELISREQYLDRIGKFLDQPIVKILVGMRRVGKSVLLKLLKQKLISKGVPQQNILYINKESLEFDSIQTYADLNRYVKAAFPQSVGPKYLLIDEVQEIKGWEKGIVSFLSEGYADLILTGSNAYLFSSELATYLSGRYVEIPVYPLTFSEFLSFRKTYESVEREFQSFLRYGSLPGIHHLRWEDEVVFGYLNSLLYTVFYKDIVARHNLREVSVLEKIVRFLFDNIGNITSAKGISDTFKSQQIKVPVDTVVNYLQYLEASFLIDRVKRFRIEGKRHLEYRDKCFLNDIGIRHGLIGYRDRDINGLLENVVYKELQSRGYQVSVGQIDQQEVDFVAERTGTRLYVQVTYLLGSPQVVEREYGALRKIPDNYEKIVLSMDRIYPEDQDGIRHQNLLDFLLRKEGSSSSLAEGFPSYAPYAGGYLSRAIGRRIARRGTGA